MFARFLAALALLFCFAMPAQAAPQHFTFDSKTLVLQGEVNGESVAKIEAALLESKDAEVTLYIASPGGSIMDGMALADLIRDSGKKVKCVAGFAASMAFAILQSCQERYVLDHSLLMQHVPSYGLNGQEPNNWSMANLIHRLSKRMDQFQADRLGMTLAAFRAHVRNDWWMYGADAVENKAADEVATASYTPELTKQRRKETQQTLFWTVNVEYSACPIIDAPLKVEATNIGTPSPEGQKEYKKIMDKLNVRSYLEQLFNKRDDSDEE